MIHEGTRHKLLEFRPAASGRDRRSKASSKATHPLNHHLESIRTELLSLIALIIIGDRVKFNSRYKTAQLPVGTGGYRRSGGGLLRSPIRHSARLTEEREDLALVLSHVIVLDELLNEPGTFSM
jgi:hypothetical protein